MSEGTCTKNPLLTKDYADLGNYALYLPAVKSSGDIYHIAAYVLLCRHYRWAEPRVCIAFDEHDTETSAKRGQGFLDLLAIKSELVDLSYQLNSTHLNPRDKKLRETLLTTYNSHDPINQKVTTALIQRAMLGYGADKIIGVLKSGFLHKSVIEGIAKPLEKWLQHKICQIKKNIKKEPFVIIHHRVSSGSNAQQNISDDEIKAITEILASKGVRVFTLVVSGAQKSTNKSNKINVFEDIAGIDSKYAKLCHIHLLAAIAELSGFKGIIGDTSGTLDVAAFMGIKVLNLHKFKLASVKKPKSIMPHQDFRITLQSNFMSVCDGITSDIISFWLDVSSHFLYSHGKRTLTARKSHIDRLGFESAYSNSGEEINTKKLNAWFDLQNNILKNQSAISQCFHDYHQIRIVEDEQWNHIIDEFRSGVNELNEIEAVVSETVSYEEEPDNDDFNVSDPSRRPK